MEITLASPQGLITLSWWAVDSPKPFLMDPADFSRKLVQSCSMRMSDLLWRWSPGRLWLWFRRKVNVIMLCTKSKTLTPWGSEYRFYVIFRGNWPLCLTGDPTTRLYTLIRLLWYLSSLGSNNWQNILRYSLPQWVGSPGSKMADRWPLSMGEMGWEKKRCI